MVNTEFKKYKYAMAACLLGVYALFVALYTINIGEPHIRDEVFILRTTIIGLITAIFLMAIRVMQISAYKLKHQ